MNSRPMNIFVTGGAGFIGSNLVEALVGQGHRVSAHDNLHLGRKEFLDPFLGRETFAFLQEDLLERCKYRRVWRFVDYPGEFFHYQGIFEHLLKNRMFA